MAQTNAERQAAYRQKHLQDEDAGCERLNVVLDLSAKRSLERMASAYGMTQRDILERVIADAEKAALVIAASLRRGQDLYYDQQIQLDYVTL